MRSIRLMAVSTIILAAAWACGSGGTDVGTPPVANFTQTCTDLACTFADQSTPAGGITGWAWDFGDPTSATNTANIQTPSHTFSAAGTFTVTLTVTDGSGATNTKTNPVVVGTANQNPVASFDLPTCTAGTPCGFHSTSTDADGTIATSHWDFGDLGTADTPDATHTYATATTVTVTLTVTDDKGGTNTATQSVTVSPAASQDCTTSDIGSGKKVVDCSLTMTQNVTVKFTVLSEDCDFTGNYLTITAPVAQTVFFNLCNRNPGDEYTVKDAAGGTLVLPQGTQLVIRFFQGQGDLGDPAATDPGIEIDGSSGNWTLKIDDGGNAGVSGEPDFDDAIVSVVATQAGP
jgi:PKD repeat protein